jgi:hypothetical protein
MSKNGDFGRVRPHYKEVSTRAVREDQTIFQQNNHSNDIGYFVAYRKVKGVR